MAALAAWALANEARAACSQAGLVVASATAAESSVADRGRGRAVSGYAFSSSFCLPGVQAGVVEVGQRQVQQVGSYVGK